MKPNLRIRYIGIVGGDKDQYGIFDGEVCIVTGSKKEIFELIFFVVMNRDVLK